MKLLANENFPRTAVDALRSEGYDVLWIRTDMPGAGDDEVLTRSVDENRILVTFDKDFGELAFRSHLPASCGIVLFRITPASPEYVAKRVIEILPTRADWAGHFAVVDETKIRMRSLPPAPSDSAST